MRSKKPGGAKRHNSQGSRKTAIRAESCNCNFQVRLSLKSDGLFIWAREAGQQFVPRRDWKNGLERQDKKEIFRLYKEIDIYRRPKGEERPERHMGHPFSPF